ncbi:hypothetical protein V6N13_032473 [Hibiscus sabdariffa]
MIEHSKKEAIHVYVEHKVEIPQYVEYEPSDVIDKNCESHVGQGGIGGPGGNVVGEVSNVGGSQELNFHLTLCDVNLGETKFKTSFEGEEAIVEGERLTTFEGPKTTFQGEKSTNFEGVEIASKGEDTSNFQAAKTNFESERSSGFKHQTILRSASCVLVVFVVAKRVDYKLVRNEKYKVIAKCKGEGCPWEIYASVDNGDGFFKCPFNGELITAVGRDANDQIYLIACAVVEKENRFSWR